MKEKWDEYLLKLCSLEINYQVLEDDTGHTKEEERNRFEECQCQMKLRRSERMQGLGRWLAASPKVASHFRGG